MQVQNGKVFFNNETNKRKKKTQKGWKPPNLLDASLLQKFHALTLQESAELMRKACMNLKNAAFQRWIQTEPFSCTNRLSDSFQSTSKSTEDPRVSQGDIPSGQWLSLCSRSVTVSTSKRSRPSTLIFLVSCLPAANLTDIQKRPSQERSETQRPTRHQKQKQQRTYLPRLESCVFHPRCHVIEPAQRKGSFRSCPAGTPWICILAWLLNSVA